MSNPALLSPAQFEALTAYVEAAVELAVTRADANLPDNNTGMEVWRCRDAFREARDAVENALVDPESGE